VEEVSQTVGASALFSREGLFYSPRWTFPARPPPGRSSPTISATGRRASEFFASEVERLGYRATTRPVGGDLLSTVTAGDRDATGANTRSRRTRRVEAGLEQPANHLLRTTPSERATLFVRKATRSGREPAALQPLAEDVRNFKFTTDALGPRWSLATWSNITYPRDGFQNGKNAIIIGMRENAARGWVELEVFCQLGGDWPVVSASRPSFLRLLMFMPPDNV
jgi:hypothetical protein